MQSIDFRPDGSLAQRGREALDTVGRWKLDRCYPSFDAGVGAAGRETVRLLPLALATVAEETPGVRRFQVVQIAPAKLSVRLEVFPDADKARVWEKMTHRLQGFLGTQGLTWVEVLKAQEPPRREPVSGKFRQVWKDL